MCILYGRVYVYVYTLIFHWDNQRVNGSLRIEYLVVLMRSPHSSSSTSPTRTPATAGGLAQRQSSVHGSPRLFAQAPISLQIVRVRYHGSAKLSLRSKAATLHVARGSSEAAGSRPSANLPDVSWNSSSFPRYIQTRIDPRLVHDTFRQLTDRIPFYLHGRRLA